MSSSVKRGKVRRRKFKKSSSVSIPGGTKRGPSFALFFDNSANMKQAAEP